MGISSGSLTGLEVPMPTRGIRLMILIVASLCATQLPCLGQIQEPVVDLARLCDLVHPDERKLPGDRLLLVLCAISDDSAPVPLEEQAWAASNHTIPSPGPVSIWRTRAPAVVDQLKPAEKTKPPPEIRRRLRHDRNVASGAAR
jgi:hypothetical protein